MLHMGHCWGQAHQVLLLDILAFGRFGVVENMAGTVSIERYTDRLDVGLPSDPFVPFV
jgi:hypothetical protein